MASQVNQPGRGAVRPHVLIAGINYAPETTGNAPYTTGLAEYLASNGFDVTVLTGMPYYPEWRIPTSYDGKLRASEERNGVHVRRFRTYIPPRQTALRRIGFEGGFFVNALLSRPPRKPDAVLGIVPSLGGAGLAALMARRYRVPYGLLFQDLVGAAARQSGMPGGARVARITASLEGRAARGAREIAVISQGFQGYLEELGVDPARIRHIPNWTHIQRPTKVRAEVRASLGWTEDQVVVLHSGAMGLKQGLEHVIYAARHAVTAAPSVRFVLMGDGNQRAMLQREAEGLPNVTFLPPADAVDFPNILAAADILLINERASLLDMALPSKLTSYLVAGRPIVAAVSPEGSTAKEVERTGAGVVVPPEDPDALVNAISRLAADSEMANRMGAAGPHYAETVLSAPIILEQARDFICDIINAKESR